MKLPILVRDAYVITAEFLWFGLVLHSDVHSKWSNTLRKQYITDVRWIASQYRGRHLYAFAPTNENKKLHKFIQSVGLVFDHYRYKLNGDRCSFYRLFPLD